MSLRNQNKALNIWMNKYLSNKLSNQSKCNHSVLTLMLETNLLVYCKCADCGRTIKQFKERLNNETINMEKK